MRISTSQIYNSGISGMQSSQSSLLKLQNQLSSGKRILTPADDPVAASQVLVMSQSMAVEEQYQVNQRSATGLLGLVDNKLSSLTEVLNRVRDNIVKAGNGSLKDSDRQSIADDVEANLNEILALANSDNGIGDYLFSGYQGGTLPFAADTTQPIVPPATAAPIAYFGDDGSRLVQVSSSRQMAVSVSGRDVFMTVKNEKGTLVTASGGNIDVTATVGAGSTMQADPIAVTDRTKWASALASSATKGYPVSINFVSNSTYTITDSLGATTAPRSYTSGSPIPLVTAQSPAVDFGANVVVSGAPLAGDVVTLHPQANQGTAVADAGSIIDAKKWDAATKNSLAGTPLEVRFSVAGGVTTYGIYDPVSKLTTGPLPYVSGQAIPLLTKNGVDFGSQVVVNGVPADGDTFTVTPGATTQSIFQVAQNLIGTLRTPVDSSAEGKTILADALAVQLSSVDQALLQVSQVQSTVGANELELESLGSTSTDLVIQYKATLSGLQDLDYVAALSDFTKQQVALEAAQKSFVQISGLSLFKYI